MSTKGVSRKGDSLSTGHGCAGSTVLDTPGQGTVYANGILVARVTDLTVSHAFPPSPPCAPHVAPVNAGAPNVWAVGKQVARISDSVDAGSMTGGSGTVFAGNA